ncbi:hybrid cluster protein [Gonapodya prolifera JEL478]|uniref:Hybrid cluster protein n=1 Tax=Gonapodya prolifera (strain JEL478) TaxID=1344416 RepID=A0A139ASP6_GONPJ|nr:hybrid cluster protein [Gonapodya prolifera JEL478]|eukprot:KXS19505.1 hybrid cluster protein [Gonapodya prolifera JEL478]
MADIEDLTPQCVDSTSHRVSPLVLPFLRPCRSPSRPAPSRAKSTPTNLLSRQFRQPSTKDAKFLVLFGSQTGTTEAFAKTFAAFARSRGMETRLLPMSEYVSSAASAGGVVKALAKESHVFIMVSTFYNGEFPDNAISFWHELEKVNPALAAQQLKNITVSVFGLGNKSNKDNFNLAARRLEARLWELKVTELVPAAYGDEASTTGHEGGFRPFCKSVWQKFGNATTAIASLPVSVRVTAAAEGAPASESRVQATHSLLEGFKSVSVKEHKLLTKAGYEKEIRLVSLETGDYPLVGHILIAAPNPSALVARVFKLLLLPGGFTLSSTVTVTPVDGGKPLTATLEDILTHHVDLNGLATRSFLEALSVVGQDPKEKESLLDTAEGMEDGNAYAKLTMGEVFSFVDAMEKYSSAKLTLEQLLSTVPSLQPRYYSIASSPLVSPGVADLVYIKETWSTRSNPAKHFNGLATGYMCGLKAGDKIAVRVQPGPINVPAPETPVVAIGLGTGIGVMRGLLQHWSALRDQGKKTSTINLFYGFRDPAKDYVFEEELAQFEKKGVCKLEIAAMDKGTLITDNIAKSSAVSTIFENKGVYIYTGPGGIVPGVVEQSVQESISNARGLHPQAAAAELAELKSDVPGQANRWNVEAFTREVDVENLLKDYSAKAETEKPLANVFEGSKMLCFQCEQTFQAKGCTTIGVCGKTPEVAALQDLLVDCVKRLGWYNHQIRQLAGSKQSAVTPELDAAIKLRDSDRFTLLSLFSTLTNVNFDPDSIRDYIVGTRNHVTERCKLYQDLCKVTGQKEEQCPIRDLSGTITDPAILAEKGKLVGVLAKFRTVKNDVVVGLSEMLVYGLKGVAAYADHAVLMGEEDIRIFDFVNEALAFTISPDVNDLNKVIGMLLKCGEANLITMETLHKGNAKHGTQSPHVVPIAPSPGKAILISGHDMKYLEELLEQTKGTGINIYTHGEMLPAHGYPKLREYGNLVGHYGVAWQRQSIEFPHFPGPIVMTTNCLTPPKEDLKHRIFMAGAVGFPGCPVVKKFNYSEVIKMAQDMPGFSEADKEYTYPRDPFGKVAKTYNVGFGLETILSVAPTVIDSIGKGDITRFYVIGGCDGFEGERSYYTDVMENLPPTSVVLTLGCGKYRILGDKLQYATIGNTGIPRLLDMGQCNDTYGAVQVAVTLAKHFNCGVNDLPLNLVISWFEQKAIAVLLTLLHLNIKGVRVGPRAPAFIRPAALQFLVETFDLKLTGNAIDDVRQMVGATA